ncbi:MAG: ADP-ribosylglycohydrolase family protein, partial [Clostridia bacterium]|nr:ADP-ribosylglycohydrolase family protein [Clostridia bacterium]
EEYMMLAREWNCAGADGIEREVEGALQRALEAVRGAEPDSVLREKEPDEYEKILELRPAGAQRLNASLAKEELRDRIMAAMCCRFAGCTLGAIVENWPVVRMENWAKTIGDAFPPVDYWSKAWSPENVRYGASAEKDYTAPGMHSVPVDDDITYTVIGLLIAEKYGLEFTTANVGQAWLDWLPVACTAEEVALRNLKNGVAAEKAAEIDNPYCQWIGAAIRSDPWGYICAGKPEKAAKMAYADAYLSHRRNGIYGEMYLAAAQAAAFVCETPEQALREGLKEIPEHCALAEDIRWALEEAKHTADWREARAKVDGRFKGMHCVHTNNNLCLVVFGLLLGGRDVTKILGEIVAMGLDNDCTAASAGSVIGAIVGMQGVPEVWTKNFNNSVDTYLTGYPHFALDDLAERFTALVMRV